MAYLVVSKSGEELIFQNYPTRTGFGWEDENIDVGDEISLVPFAYGIKLPLGSIEKLIGKKLSYTDNPVRI